jgi:hypothetical protein
VILLAVSSPPWLADDENPPGEVIAALHFFKSALQLFKSTLQLFKSELRLFKSALRLFKFMLRVFKPAVPPTSE